MKVRVLALGLIFSALILSSIAPASAASLTVRNVRGSRSGISGQLGISGILGSDYANAQCFIYRSNGKYAGGNFLDLGRGNGYRSFSCGFSSFPGSGTYYARIDVTVYSLVAYRMSISTPSMNIR